MMLFQSQEWRYGVEIIMNYIKKLFIVVLAWTWSNSVSKTYGISL